MIEETNYSPCGNIKISAILDEMGVGPDVRSGSYFDIDLSKPENGKFLSLNSLFTKNASGVLHNVPLTTTQVDTLMKALQGENVVLLDLAGNKFDDNALKVILNNLPKTVTTLSLIENDFTENSIRLLTAFNSTRPECEISTNEYTYICIHHNSIGNHVTTATHNFDHDLHLSGECTALGNDVSSVLVSYQLDPTD